VIADKPDELRLGFLSGSNDEDRHWIGDADGVRELDLHFGETRRHQILAT
jgi:hypothetical protein